MIWFIVLICSRRGPRLLMGEGVLVSLVSLRCKLISHPEEYDHKLLKNNYSFEN